MSGKRELNDYLAAEWGLDFERAADDRPFALTPGGELDDEPSFDDLRVQELDSDWIGERDPVDHRTARLGDARPTRDRAPRGDRAPRARPRADRTALPGLILDGEPPVPVPRMPLASRTRRMMHAAGFRLLQSA